MAVATGFAIAVVGSVTVAPNASVLELAASDVFSDGLGMSELLDSVWTDAGGLVAVSGAATGSGDTASVLTGGAISGEAASVFAGALSLVECLSVTVSVGFVFSCEVGSAVSDAGGLVGIKSGDSEPPDCCAGLFAFSSEALPGGAGASSGENASVPLGAAVSDGFPTMMSRISLSFMKGTGKL